MILCFAGTPGSGKTYEAVKKIIDNLRQGRVVYTNIDGMDDGKCLEMIKSTCGLSDYGLTKHLKFFEEDQIEDFWMHVEPGCLIVLDEIQKYFSSREWQSEKNKIFGVWSSTHRHHGYDVVLITQHVDRLDSAVRALLEWTYVFRKINFFGGAVTKKYMCYSYGGDDTRGAPLAKSARTYDDIIFLCYHSYVTNDTKELGIMKHVNVLKHPVFYALPLAFAVVIYMVFFKSSIGTGDLFGSKKVMAIHDKTKVQASPKKSNAKYVPAAKSYTVHTPNIFQVKTKSGQIMFSNRTINAPVNAHETKKPSA